MFWFMLIALVVVVAAVALAVLGNGGALPDAGHDRLDDPLPSDRPVRPADLDTLRIAVTLRGYRMADVDDVLDRVGAELAERDARIAELEAVLAGPRDAAPGAPGIGRPASGGPGAGAYPQYAEHSAQPPGPRYPHHGPSPAEDDPWRDRTAPGSRDGRHE